MSAIDPRQARALTRFYERHLKPLSKAAGPSNAEAPANSEASYFVRRPRTRLDRSDFELSLGDESQAAGTLERAWSGTQLGQVARPMMRLTRTFDEVEDRSTVSPSFYEMF